MDVGKLCLALEHTLSNLKEQRESAINFIQQLQSQPDFISSLLQIATDTSLPIVDHIRQSAAVHLKNILISNQISIEDNTFLSQNLFPFMIKTQLKQVYVQLASCIYSIAKHKLPNDWPLLFDQLTNALTNPNDAKALHAALTIVYSLCKIYRLEMGKRREVFDVVISKTFGLLYEVAIKLIGNPGEQVGEYMKLIVRSFMCNSSGDISGLLIKEEVFGKWMWIFQKAFEWPMNPELEVPTEDEEVIKVREKSEVLKMKKAVARIFHDLYRKYGDSNLASKEYKDFSKLIETNYSKGIIRLNLQILQSSKVKFIHPSILSMAFKVLEQTVSNKFKMEIHSALIEILKNYAFPQLLISAKDAKLCEEDPQEFIKFRMENVWDDYEPRCTAMRLIYKACIENSYYNDSKDSCHPILADFLSFLTTVLDKSIKENEARVFDAGLFAVGSLEEEIEKYEILVSSIEPTLKQYILPNLTNPLPIIRMRCAWVYLKFAKVDFKDIQSLIAAFKELVKGLKASELLVRYTAALAIASLVSNKILADQLRPHVVEVISVYLELIRDIDSERLIEALNELIKTFGEEIKPYGIELVKEIIKAYYKLTDNSKDKNEQDYEWEKASSACLDAIGTLIQIIGNNPSLQEIKTLLLPIIYKCFIPDETFLDKPIDILGRLSYYSKTINGLWEFFPLIIRITVGTSEEAEAVENIKEEGNWGYKYLRDFKFVLQNIITKDSNQFLGGSCTQGSYIDLLFMLINRIIEISKYSRKDFDAIPAIELIITILESLKVLFQYYD